MLAILPLGVLAANAQTVESIKKGGVLKVGAQVAQVPWGFTDSRGKLTGFDIEVMEMLAKELGVKAEFTGVTPANRTAALLTGQVDVLAAVMGIFADRQKVVLFARPYATIDNIIIGKADASIKGWDDAKGLRVGVPRGNPIDVAVTKASPPGATIQRFDDDFDRRPGADRGPSRHHGWRGHTDPEHRKSCRPGQIRRKICRFACVCRVRGSPRRRGSGAIT